VAVVDLAGPEYTFDTGQDTKHTLFASLGAVAAVVVAAVVAVAEMAVQKLLEDVVEENTAVMDMTMNQSLFRLLIHTAEEPAQKQEVIMDTIGPEEVEVEEVAEGDSGPVVEVVAGTVLVETVIAVAVAAGVFGPDLHLQAKKLTNSLLNFRVATEGKKISILQYRQIDDWRNENRYKS
jgi:hypothetical protein